VSLGAVEAVSLLAGGVVLLLLSTVVESEVPASLPDPQPAAIDPTIIATSANFKMFFFMG